MLLAHNARRLRSFPRLLSVWQQLRLFNSNDLVHNVEQVTIPCRAGQSFTLDIHKAASTSDPHPLAVQSDSPAIIIVLPSGLAVQDDTIITQERQIPHQLAECTHLPVVRINYRLSQTHRFPTPLYDILSGYDWIVKNLLPTPSSTGLLSRSNKDHARSSWLSDHTLLGTAHQARIGLYGSGIGGSLALAIGLTECRIATSASSLLEYPARMVAVAASDAVTDWVLRARYQDEQPETIDQLNQLDSLRDRYFDPRRKQDPLDPFASPVLFFRTPGVEPTMSDAQSSSSNSDPRASHGNVGGSTPEDHDTSPAITDQRKPRYYARRFPPTSMGTALLPSMHLGISREAGVESLLGQQTAEFVRLVKRAMVRQGMPSGTGQKVLDEVEVEGVREEKENMLADLRRFSEERVKLEVGTEEDSQVDGEMDRVGRWFRETLSGVKGSE